MQDPAAYGARSLSEARRLQIQRGKQLVSVTGQPLVDERKCAACGAGIQARQVVTSFGGNWRVLCSCGLEFDRGVGDPPVGGEI